jgi:hypothetical protein
MKYSNRQGGTGRPCVGNARSHHADTQAGRVAWRTDFRAKASIAQSC